MDSWEDGFISAARFALENKRLVYHIYNSVSRERVERYLYSIAGEVMRLYVSRITEQVEHAAHKKVFPEDQKMVVDFYKFALVGMILDWLNTGMKKDPEELIRRVGEIFHGNIGSSPDPCGPLIWTFVHVCTYILDYLRAMRNFCALPFFGPFSRLDSLHTIPIEKESTTKGALFYEIW